MKSIQLLHTLLEYDYPQVFVARDAISVRYVCMVVEEGEYGPVFLCVPVSAQRCTELLNGKLDLRLIYEKPELSEFYHASPCSGQLIPDTVLSFSSALAGASPLLN